MKTPQTIEDMQTVAQQAFDKARDFRGGTLRAIMCAGGLTIIGEYGWAAGSALLAASFYGVMQGHKKRGQDIEDAIAITRDEVRVEFTEKSEIPNLSAGDRSFIKFSVIPTERIEPSIDPDTDNESKADVMPLPAGLRRPHDSGTCSGKGSVCPVSKMSAEFKPK
jgi:hypothetical protein